MANEVLSRCFVHGPPDAIDQFKVERFCIDVDGDLVMDFEHIVPAPPIFERFRNAGIKTDLYALLLLGAREGIAIYPDPCLELFLFHQASEQRSPGSPITREVAEEIFARHPKLEQVAWNTFHLARETGYASEFHWRRERWGATSIGYGCDLVAADPFEFLMVTAQGFPAPIFDKLATLYPDLSFDARSILEDESGGGWLNGQRNQPTFEIGKLTREIQFRVRGCYPDAA